MKYISKLFWFLLPVALLVGTYREANSTVLRYWAFSQDRDAVMATSKDLNRIIMLVATNYRMSHGLPADLKVFLEQMPTIGMESRTRAIDVDAWLTPYQLRDLGERYEVVSCGPDRKCETALDNLAEGAIKVNHASPTPTGEKNKIDEMLKNTEEMKKNVDSYNKQLEELK